MPEFVFSDDRARNWLNEFGSPMFILDMERFKSKLISLQQDAIASGLDARFFYSYKTNSLSALCWWALQGGWGAEVISLGELKQALRVGNAGEDIVYNGPYKETAAIELALGCGATIHVDSIEELHSIVERASSLGCPAQVGVRLQVDSVAESWSKFGIAPDHLEEYLQTTEVPNNVNVRGLHMHIGTNIVDLERYRAPFRLMLTTAQRIEDLTKTTLQYLDIGGGMAASKAMPMDILPGSWNPPPPQEYFVLLADELRKHQRERQRIYIEPGRLVVADCMHYACTVRVVKSVRGRKIVITDGNINHLPSAYYMHHPIIGLSSEARAKVRGDIYGPICTQFDSLGMDVELPDPKAGDVIVVLDAGAYSLAFSNQFAFPRPAVIGVSGSTSPLLLRRRESDDAFWQEDVLGPFVS